ncbi:MAG TPA: SCE4755 family polysaccharide monooxygenase-like protein [Polyangiaceae bacterium]
MKKRAVALGVLWLALSARAEAHFDIQAPPPADTAADGGKGPPPCGPSASSNIVTPAQGGHALTLQLDETVFHPGFYRVALAQNSPSELPADNLVKDKLGNVLAPDSTGLSDTAEYQTTPIYPVLADHLFAHDTPDVSQFQTELPLPNIDCEHCTLQVIEFMSNSNSNLGGGYFYHHCATLKITADPSPPAFTPVVSSGGASGAASGGCSSSARGPRSAPRWFGLPGLLALLRIARRRATHMRRIGPRGSARVEQP